MTDTAEAFDPVDSAYRSDPYTVYRRLLEGARVHHSTIGSKVLVRYPDCLAVLHHPAASTDTTQSELYAQAVEAGLAPPPDEMPSRSFLFMDPPDHTRLRGLVSKAFTPRRVEALRPRIAAIVDDLLATAADQDPFDVVEQLAYPLPVQVICELMGVPVADHHRFAAWSRSLARSLDPDFSLSPEERQARDEAVGLFREYFLELIATRRSAPGEDLLSALIAAEEAGDRLTEEELLSTLILLLVAGHETTVNLIANGALAFLRHPDQLVRLQADPGLIGGAVEEVLRFDPPVQLDGRTFVEPTEVNGIEIGAREQVLLVLAAANRDGDVFTDPDHFDIGRRDVHHLSFGHGIHHCLGAALARAEGQAALSAMAGKFTRWELAADELAYKDNIILRGLVALPVRLAA